MGLSQLLRTGVSALARTRLTSTQPIGSTLLPSNLIPSITSRPALSPFSHYRRTMATQASSLSDFGHFKLLQSFDIKYAPVKVSKWRSEKTGLTVVVGDHAAPVVSLSISLGLAHELKRCRQMDTLRLPPRVRYRVSRGSKSDLIVFDDTGRPHTLEQ